MGLGPSMPITAGDFTDSHQVALCTVRSLGVPAVLIVINSPVKNGSGLAASCATSNIHLALVSCRASVVDADPA